MVTKLKSKNYITKNFKISKKFFIIIDRIIRQKLPILKQGVKTINSEFIRTRALSQLSFIQFRPYATSFPGLLLSLTLMPKSKKTLVTSSDFTLSLRPPLTQGLRVLFRTWIIWKIVSVILFKRNMAEDVCRRIHVSYSGVQFFFAWTFYTIDDSKGKKRINKALSKQSKQFLLLFLFFGLKE